MIRDPMTFGITGAPVYGTPPPALRVMGEATPEQRAAAQVVYARFCETRRSSVVSNPTESGRLVDGSPYRIAVVGPQTTMFLWPVGGGDAAPGNAIAYPVFFDLEYMPVFDRHVIDDPDPDMPQPPVIPPEPVFTPTTEIYQPNYVGNVTEWSMVGSGDSWVGVYRDNLTGELFTTPPPLPFDAALVNRAIKTQEENDRRDAHNIAETAAYQASLAAREDEFVAWQNTVYFPWLNAKNEALIAYAEAVEAWEESKTPYPGMDTLRSTGRSSQSSAVRAFLNAGMSEPHVAARLLTFAVNVEYRRTLDFPANPGSVSSTASTVGDVATATYDLFNAGPTAVVIDTAAPNIVVRARSPFLLRDDIASFARMFGWMANGTITRQRQYLQEHENEPMQSLVDVAFSELPGYSSFAASSMVQTDAKNQTINTEAFVPERARLTIVFLEYECYDAFRDAWTWCPHPEMTDVDAVWKKDLGHHYDPRPDVDPQRPRAVRARGSIVQVRAGAGWTTAGGAAVSWGRTLDGPPLALPSALVIADRLPKFSIPIPDGITVFPFGQRGSDVREVRTITGRLDAAWAGVAP